MTASFEGDFKKRMNPGAGLVTVEERSASLPGGPRSSPISPLISLWSSFPFLPNWILQERCPSAAEFIISWNWRRLAPWRTWAEHLIHSPCCKPSRAAPARTWLIPRRTTGLRGEPCLCSASGQAEHAAGGARIPYRICCLSCTVRLPFATDGIVICNQSPLSTAGLHNMSLSLSLSTSNLSYSSPMTFSLHGKTFSVSLYSPFWHEKIRQPGGLFFQATPSGRWCGTRRLVDMKVECAQEEEAEDSSAGVHLNGQIPQPTSRGTVSTSRHDF